MQADASKPVLSVRGLSKRFGSLVTANKIDLDIYPYQLHSFLGPNGAGKTTFFNMLTGILPPSEGSIVFEGRDITRLPVHKRIKLGMSRSFQILSIFKNLTVFENVRVAVQAAQPGLPSLWRDAHDMAQVNDRTWSLLDAVGLADRAAEGCTDLSHGEQRLLEIAVSLAMEARLLLLDEPLAGLAEADREIVAKLIRTLARQHAVILIEHDMDRVLAISDRVTVLHRGQLIADGKPAEVAVHPLVIEAYLGTKGAQASPAPDAAAAGSGTAGTVHPQVSPAQPVLQPTARTGKTLLKIEGLKAGYNGSTIIDGLNLSLNEGEVLAVLGRNGVGKTSTLRAIMGAMPVSAGRISFDGQEITNRKSHAINRAGISIVPEGRRLFPNLTVYENLVLAARPGGISVDKAYELFPRLHNRRNIKAESLSGGERQMVAIARALMAPARLILLDEPFEGLAPAVVQEVMEAVKRLRGQVSMIIVEHHAESVLGIADRACVLVNGKLAYEGAATDLAADTATQARLLGIVHE